MKWPELNRKLDKAPGVERLRQKGSHIQWRLPDGSIETTVDHNDDMGKGIWCKISKHLIRAGVAIGGVAAIIYAGLALAGKV